MRGRVSAVNSLFVGASNELGEFESAVVLPLTAERAHRHLEVSRSRMSAVRRGIEEDRYEAVVLVKNCAAVAGIAQGSKVKISNIALQKD